MAEGLSHHAAANTADCVMTEECIRLILVINQLQANKGYDTDAIRAFLKKYVISPLIAGKSNFKKTIRNDKKVFKAAMLSNYALAG